MAGFHYHEVCGVWDSREFRAKYADSSAKVYRAAWLGRINADLREERDTCSWEVHGSITREVRIIGEGEESLEMPEMTMPLSQREAFDVNNSGPEKFKGCSARYEGDLDTVRRKIKESVQRIATSDLPAAMSLINELPGVVGVTGPYVPRRNLVAGFFCE
jgi:hypothetical protein